MSISFLTAQQSLYLFHTQQILNSWGFVLDQGLYPSGQITTAAFGCDFDRVRNGVCITAAVGLDEQPVKSEDGGTAVLSPVGQIL